MILKPWFWASIVQAQVWWDVEVHQKDPVHWSWYPSNQHRLSDFSAGPPCLVQYNCEAPSKLKPWPPRDRCSLTQSEQARKKKFAVGPDLRDANGHIIFLILRSRSALRIHRPRGPTINKTICSWLGVTLRLHRSRFQTFNSLGASQIITLNYIKQSWKVS